MASDAVKWSERDETAKQLRRFLVVGLLSVATDLVVYYALDLSFGMATNLAKAVSYLAGVLVGFLLNKWWTFESARQSWSEPLTYFALYSITLGINVGCNHVVLTWLGEDFRLLAFLFATGVSTVLNFLGMRLVTFRRGIAERREGTLPTLHNVEAS